MKIIYLILFTSIGLLISACKKKSTTDGNTPGEQQLKQGLLAYYPFNGSGKDEGPNGYNLLVKGAVLTNNRFGEAKKACKFNGVSDIVIIPKLLKGDSLREFTISAWANMENVNYSSIISFLSKGSQICSSHMGFGNSGRATWHQVVAELEPYNCITTIISDSIASPINKWSHVVLVQRFKISGGIYRYEYSQYYDGRKLKIAGSPFDGVVPVPISFSQGGVIGGDNTSGDFDYNFNLFTGGIDDIRIYDRALSDDEVSQLYKLRE